MIHFIFKNVESEIPMHAIKANEICKFDAIVTSNSTMIRENV